MKLSDLIPHTSTWVGIPEAQIRTVVRALRPAGLLSTAGQNPLGAEMTDDDKINLLLGVCGVEIANRAAEHVRVWLKVPGVKTLLSDLVTRAKQVEYFIDFEIDAFCVRYGDKIFGKPSKAPSVLIRRVSADALRRWIAGL